MTTASTVPNSFLEQPEKHICVDCAFVRLVENDDRIRSHQRVDETLAQQHTVGHVLYLCVGRCLILEADRVTDLK